MSFWSKKLIFYTTLYNASGIKGESKKWYMNYLVEIIQMMWIQICTLGYFIRSKNKT